jgi:hypothetical protein
MAKTKRTRSYKLPKGYLEEIPKREIDRFDYVEWGDWNVIAEVDTNGQAHGFYNKPYIECVDDYRGFAVLAGSSYHADNARYGTQGNGVALAVRSFNNSQYCAVAMIMMGAPQARVLAKLLEQAADQAESHVRWAKQRRRKDKEEKAKEEAEKAAAPAETNGNGHPKMNGKDHPRLN